ncbi:MAG TPA: hypothetical protein VGC08_16380 [Pedobacter sp.]|jgi:hypothetical protein
MFVKLTLLSSALARQERVTKQKALTRKQWVTIDRIVMILLFAGVIAGAIVFS